MTEEAPIPLRARIIMFTLSCLVALGCAEGLIRLVDGGAMPMIHLFEPVQGSSVRLVPGSQMRVLRADAEPWTLAISQAGFREDSTDAPAPEAGGWLVVGDSQVMGSGVEASEAFPAQARIHGTPMINAGVPGFGVVDALARAEGLLDTLAPAGVVLIINQMNDWDEAGAPVGARYVVRGGWLLDMKDAHGTRAAFLGSPLSRSHLFFLIGQLVLRDWSAPPAAPPEWMTHPEAQTKSTLEIARAVQAFAARHEDIQLVPVYLPADIYVAEDRKGESPLGPHLDAVQTPPWTDTRLRDTTLTALTGLNPLDLTPVLQGRADAFLSQDYHLSVDGHRRVAAAISSHIQAHSSPTP